MEEANEQMQERIKKLERLRDANIEPYGDSFDARDRAADIHISGNASEKAFYISSSDEGPVSMVYANGCHDKTADLSRSSLISKMKKGCKDSKRLLTERFNVKTWVENGVKYI